MTLEMHEPWFKDSWKSQTNFQEINYLDLAEINYIQNKLESLPELNSISDLFEFKKDMISVAKGEKFLLHAGDCAELFENCSQAYIFSQLNLLDKLVKLIKSGLGKDVCCIGRIAGQYAKPRTFPVEKRGKNQLTSYFGDIVNSFNFIEYERFPDPNRMLLAYKFSAKTINYLREWFKCSDIKVYTSHEALILPYEQALTRDIKQEWYNMSCHFPWVGMRTAQPNSAHIEYIRGIKNPIGIKVGPDISCDALLNLIKKANPLNQVGRLTLIYRFGKKAIAESLQSLLFLIKRHGINATLCCDPMHGNTVKNEAGLKVRKVEDIIDELMMAIKIHQRNNIPLNGLHLEVVNDDRIYECIDADNRVDGIYRTKVDPRLNPKQSKKVVESVISQMNACEFETV